MKKDQLTVGFEPGVCSSAVLQALPLLRPKLISNGVNFLSPFFKKVGVNKKATTREDFIKLVSRPSTTSQKKLKHAADQF